MIPVIAVASEHQIFFFKEYSPLMRFDLPMIKFSEEENNIWKQMAEAHEEAAFLDLTEQLYKLREKGTSVSALSSELLSFEEVGPQREFFERKKSSALLHRNYITCMSKINKDLEDEKNT